MQHLVNMNGQLLIHWGQVMHICICNLAIIGSDNQYWNMVNGTLRNKLQWNFNWNILIQGNTFESVVCKMVAILSQCVKLFYENNFPQPFQTRWWHPFSGWMAPWSLYFLMLDWVWFNRSKPCFKIVFIWSTAIKRYQLMIKSNQFVSRCIYDWVCSQVKNSAIKKSSSNK